MLRVDSHDKEKLIAPLFRTSPAFLVAILFLLVVLSWGIYHYVLQVVNGLGQTGMDRPSYWGIYMVNFIFFIGISHAGTLISAILRVTGAEWRRPITRVAEAITAFALVVGTLQIIIDMGRPDRLWFVLRHGRLQSPILWDVVSVTMYFLGSVTYLYLPLIPDAAILRDNCPDDAPGWQRRLYTILALGWRGNKEQWLRLEKAISIMAVVIIPVAVSVHTIISWILATTVQPGWHSSIFGPYFVVGAIFSGIGALFLAMTAVRRVLGLEEYITVKQYQNLGLIFVTMCAIWAYFTYAENLGIAAGQQVDEFPVLASKLWGEYASSFWAMVALMVLAFWILAAPRLMPASIARMAIFQPRFAPIPLGTALLTLVLLVWPELLPINADITAPSGRAAGYFLLVILTLGFGFALASWLKDRPVAGTSLAAVCVVIGMWLERWIIIVPTMTRPRLIEYTSYSPTITELSLMAASFALFGLLFLTFFKFFPAVSIWEVAEGRVIEKANSQISIPEPEPTPRRRIRRWGYRR